MTRHGFPVPEDVIGHGAGQRKWVNCTFFGATPDEVGKKRKKYLEEYPPQGYDTRTEGGVYTHPDGYYLIRMVRWSTCS